ncbi:MAG: hypothetical protein KJT03_09580 [Verrucomicrobiae bacterium]|nr:hypothetical protein [Verrucomicrobiae bacterium]
MKTLFIGMLAGAVLLGGCVSTPQSRVEENKDLFESFTAAQKETILKGEVDLGFTPEMVLMAAGTPDRKAKKRSNLGTTEVWTYYRFQPRPISGYGYGGYHGYFTYNSYYGSWVRNPFLWDHAIVAQYGEPEKNLVVDFQEGKVVSFEMVQ